MARQMQAVDGIAQSCGLRIFSKNLLSCCDHTSPGYSQLFTSKIYLVGFIMHCGFPSCLCKSTVECQRVKNQLSKGKPSITILRIFSISEGMGLPPIPQRKNLQTNFRKGGEGWYPPIFGQQTLYLVFSTYFSPFWSILRPFWPICNLD